MSIQNVYTNVLKFEWDPNKNARNLRQHGIDFEDAVGIFDRPVLEGLDDRCDYGEERIIAYGEVNQHVIAVVYTWRAGSRRIISARKAARNEREAYYRAL